MGGLRFDAGMPELTRRRYKERADCWQIYFDDVQAGTIAKRTGAPIELRAGVAGIPVEPNRGRFSRVAGCPRLDRSEICHVGSWRTATLAETQFADAVFLWRGFR